MNDSSPFSSDDDRDAGEQVVYLSGRYVPKKRARVPAFDRGFLYGDGFFETTRITGGKAMHLERHLKRLSASCAATGWEWEPARGTVECAVSELTLKNRVTEGYLRITVSRGLHAGALASLDAHSPAILIEARTMDLEPLDSATPLTLMRSPYRRNEFSPTVRHKSLSYQDNLLALSEARTAAGADEVYFLNSSGFLCEGAVTNLFWIRGGEFFTPAAECGLLPGITRDIVLEITAREGIPSHKGNYREEELLAADEVFCTNSLRGVIPVRGLLSGVKEKKWSQWPLTRRLAGQYSCYC